MTTSTRKFCQHLVLPPTHFLDFSLATKLQRPFLQLSLWLPEHMAHYDFPLLIIIPGIYNLACLHDDKITCYTDKILLILLKFISPYIATLHLFYHCTSMFISYALYAKFHQLRDYLC